MTSKLTLYSRRDCCLCAEMKAVIRQLAATTAFDLAEIDIDTNGELQQRYKDQVPVLFIDGRKAFKYRVSAKQLAKKLKRKPFKLSTAIAGFLGKRQS